MHNVYFSIVLLRRYRLSSEESMEVISQNTNMLDTIIKASNSVLINQLPFSNLVCDLYAGMWVDVKDTIDQWLEA